MQEDGQALKEPAADASGGPCHGCQSGHCPASPALDHAPLEGGRFALASLAFFGGPLLFAIIGASLYPANPHAQLAGAMIGLGLGGACWGFIVTRIAGKDEE